MRYPRFPGVGERVKERLLALGYVKADGEPDIARFIREKHYDPRSFYPWTKGRTPAGKNLDRLVLDLECSRAWLLLGEEVATPIAGGSGESGTLYLLNVFDYLPLISHALQMWFRSWAQPLHLNGAFA